MKRKRSNMLDEDADDKKIVEVPRHIYLNTKIFPKLIPKNIRFKCFLSFCSYFCMTKGRLKNHIKTFHPDHHYYICPHCPPTSIGFKIIKKNQIEFHLMHHGENLYRCQYCDYIDFNRIEMRAHMKNTHLPEIKNSIQSNIIVIRQGMLEDYNTNRAPSTVPQWVCNLCNTGTICTENQIKSHLRKVHKKSGTFKCPICKFQNSDDDTTELKNHLMVQHPCVAVPKSPKWEHII